MQEHDATLEIISPHCHTTLMQYEEETQICSPTLPQIKIKIIFGNWMQFENDIFVTKLQWNYLKTFFLTAKLILFNDPIFIAKKWLINKKK